MSADPEGTREETHCGGADHPDRGDGWCQCGQFAYVDRAGGRVVTALDLGTPALDADKGVSDGVV